MKQYSRVRLKTGENAHIVEVLENGKAYIADIEREDGETITDFITHDQIASIII